MARDFKRLLEAKWDRGFFLCVGLDTDLDKLPAAFQNRGAYEGALAFNTAIVDATKDLVCGYKPNAAFYEAHGEMGWRALRDTVAYIHEAAPEAVVVLDAKRADIGNTNNGYVASAFDHIGADAITVHPYFGKEALAPFLARTDKGIIVLVRSSNAGSGEFQMLDVGGTSTGPGASEPLYRIVARHVVESWNTNGNCLVMAGATYPEELAAVRSIVGDMPILIPGIGAQGGDLEQTIAAAKDSRGRGMIICASRSVIFASGGDDFAEAARKEVESLNGAIAKAL